MDKELPDLYSDQVSVAMSAFGIALTFSLSPSDPSPLGGTPPGKQAVVRMSLEHAKLMTMVLRNRLKQFELEHLGDPINLPRKVLDAMNLTLDDW
jgi:hypothetical protein